MKTYTTYGRCRSYSGCSPIPTHRGGVAAWTTRGELTAMRSVEEAVYAQAGLPDDRRFDRLFNLVTDGADWGVRCELFRGFPGELPNITIHVSEAEARAAFAAVIERYAADRRWVRV